MAYVIKGGRSDKSIPSLPHTGALKDGTKVTLDVYRESEITEMWEIFRDIVEEGQTYPMESVDSLEEFRAYYLSHDGFVVSTEEGEVVGAFYVKPNYPGRSSHICNAGFIVKRSWRNRGVGRFLVPLFLRVARDLGYRASVFNLVYVTNEASLKLWERFGFRQVGRIPEAGNLKGLGYVDAVQYYYDLTTVKD